MKLRIHYLAFAVAAIAFASCKNSNTQGRYIPANAAFAFHVDGKSISEKLPWAEIKNNPLFKEAYADTGMSASMKKILDNPENSGIDSKADFVAFVLQDSIGGYFALEGSVKDEAAFKTFITELNNNGSAIESDGINYVSHYPTCAGWSKDRFILINDLPDMGKYDALAKRMLDDSIDISPRQSRDILATCKSVFALAENNSMAKDERFSALLKESADMHFWINSAAMNEGKNMPAMMSMINLDKLVKGSATAMAISFDNGKITAKTHSYAGEDLTKLYKKYEAGKVNEDMLKRMPGKDVAALFAFNFNPEGLRDFLKLLNLDGLINMGAASMGFNLDDFIKANKGDIMFGLSDFKVEADTSNLLLSDEMTAPKMNKPSFNFVFAASIGEKDAFNKLVDAGKKLGGRVAADEPVPFAFSNNGTYFALANTQENADLFMKGGNANADIISKISGEPMGGYFNIQSILKGVGTQAIKDSSSRIIYDASLKFWDNLTFKGGSFSNGSLNSVIEVNLADKNANSLKQLNDYIFKVSEVMRDKRRKQKEDMMAFEDALNPSSGKDSAGAAAMPDIKEK